MDSGYWIHLAFGPLILLVAILFRLLPPKKINYFYGYRTPRSMSNQQIWDYSNKYAARVLIYASSITILIQLLAIFTFSFTTSVILGAVTVCMAAISVLPFTELYISRSFDSEGNKIIP